MNDKLMELVKRWTTLSKIGRANAYADFKGLLEEQQQECADNAYNQAQLLCMTEDESEAISDACLNATGENDE